MNADAKTETTIAKPEGPFAEGPLPNGQIGLKRILVPVDFSKTSRKAVRYARRFAEVYGAKVTLFHVVDFADIDRVALRLGSIAQERMEAEAMTRASSLIQQVADQELGDAVEHDSDILAGRTTDAVIEEARRCKADLIVVGVHSERVIKHAIIGSTAERVVRSAPCPVLVVRDHEHEFIET